MAEEFTATLSTLKKCYTIGEVVIPSITVAGFAPSKRDWLGVFSVGVENDNPHIYQWVPVDQVSEDAHQKETILSVSLKLDFSIDDDSLKYEVRYIDADQKMRGKSKPFGIAAVTKQESMITVKEGTCSDDSLVLIDKISVGVDGLPFPDEDSEDLNNNTEILENLEVPQNELESNNAAEKAGTDTLQVEVERRINAESAVEELSRKLGEQMNFIDMQRDELTDLRNTCERNKHVKESFMSEFETMQENTEVYATELEETKDIAINYKAECTQLQSKSEKDEELIDLLKLRILDDRDQQEETISRVKEIAGEKLEVIQKKIEALENTLEKKREKMSTLNHINERHEGLIKERGKEIEENLAKIESLNTELENQKKNYETLIQENERENLDTLNQINEKHAEILKKKEQEIAENLTKTKSLNEKLEKQKENHEKLIQENEKEHMDTLNQINEKHAELLKEKENEIEENLKKIESLNKESENQKQNHGKLIQENEKILHDLESRVVNESSNASRLENELATAENRYRESTDDIKFFRQKFIDTEQKLSKSQQQLSRTMIELNNLKNLAHRNRVDSSNAETEMIIPTTKSKGTETKSESAASATMTNEPFTDDKPTTCESLCASTCASTETFVSMDIRRRTQGDVTDDESWCNESIRSQSIESISPFSQASETRRPRGGVIPFNLYCLQKDADENLLKPQEIETVTEIFAQIPVIADNNRRIPKKGRRRYSPAIDLSPSPSIIDERRQANQFQQFNKDISDLDRENLEKQYAAIRQHRNSLIRKTTHLKDQITQLKTNLAFTNTALQNLALEAEHKVGMLQYALFNVSQNQMMQFIQSPLENQLMLTPALIENANIANDDPANYLSPFAEEYTPMVPPSQQEMYGFVGQQADQGNFFPVPQNLPIPPLPPQAFLVDGIDVSEQLANIGVCISNQ